MVSILNEEVALAAALPLILVVTQALHSTHIRYRAYAKARCVAHIANMIVAHEEPSDSEICRLKLRFPTEAILDAAIFVSEHIYGNALYRLLLIVEVCGLEQHLLRTMGHAITKRHRLQTLAKLSQLAPASVIVGQSNLYSEYDEKELRTYATAALVMARPERAIRYVARLTHRLSLHDVAMLSQLMRRAGVPIAYTPLLTSQSHNLQLIGIYLCEHLSIVDAEPLLQQLCTSEDIGVSHAALYAICTLRGDISTSEVKQAVMHLSPSQRDALIRHMIYSCYSLRSCAHLLDSKEQRCFTQRLNAYKCRIACN